MVVQHYFTKKNETLVIREIKEIENEKKYTTYYIITGNSAVAWGL
jgi:hypothetical protein